MGAPLLAGARYAGLTQRQSQAAFSYMPAPQNWQVISKRILGIFRDDARKGSKGFPARLKIPHRRTIVLRADMLDLWTDLWCHYKMVRYLIARRR